MLKKSSLFSISKLNGFLQCGIIMPQCECLKWNTSWVYRGVGGICVLLYMLSLESKLDDRGVGSTSSWGSMNLCKVRSSPSNCILKDCLGV
jgi:hypothetical protein